MSPFGRSFADGDRLEVAGAVVRLHVNARARRVSLRLDRRRREIVATAPSARRLAEAAAFARSREAWIARCLAALPQRQVLAPGEVIEVFGETVRLEAGQGRARWLPCTEDAPVRIAAMGEAEGFSRAVALVVRRRALQVLTERTAHHAARLGAPMPKVAVMDAKARWGSCKPGSIRYSWRLALAPLEVADYVVAHEVAHLKELNHGPRFWAHVAFLVDDVPRKRAWLRAHGEKLHAFGAG